MVSTQTPGAGTSNNARDAFGTTTSNFGFPGNAFFDGELVKFGNLVTSNYWISELQTTLVLRKLKNISFDFRKASTNSLTN